MQVNLNLIKRIESKIAGVSTGKPEEPESHKEN